MRRLFRRRRKCTYVLLLVTLLVLSSLTYYITEMRCTNEHSVEVLKNLCTDYKHERVAGNLCPHLCQMHTVWFHSCMNYRGGKNVFKMKWMDEMIILKSKKPRIDDYDLPLYTSLLSDFTGMVAQSVSMNLPVAQKALTDAQIFSIMWMDDVEKYATRRTVGGEEEVLWQSSAMNSLWSLVQQDEYMILKFFQHFPHMPRIFGTCGHFYALEYMPPGPMLSAGILEMTRIFGHSWSDRAKLALKLLETIHAFDNDLTEVLHMCDMKGENFGISKAGKVVAIDVDMAVFDTKLVSDLSYPNCSIHDDCSFFDCQGWCDIPNQKCSGIRVNNNLQSLCKKILINDESTAFTGLLRGPPRSIPDLRTVIQECASPLPSGEQLPGCTADGSTIMCPKTADKVAVKFRTDPRYYERLKTLIEISLM